MKNLEESKVAVQMNGETVFVTPKEKEGIMKKTLKAMRKIGKAKYYGDAFNMYLPRTPEKKLAEA